MSQSRPYCAMTKDEQDEHREVTNVIRSCVSSLRLTRCTDEDVVVALARLENWLSENDGRWTINLSREVAIADAFTPPDPFSRKA